MPSVISTLSTGARRPPPSSTNPTARPRNFKPFGDYKSVDFSSCPPFIKKARLTSSTKAKAAGLRHERKVQEWLTTQYGSGFQPNVWLELSGSRRLPTRYCELDGFIFRLASAHITIVEIKLSHTSDAWWQLRRLYQPALQKMFPPEIWSYSVVEIVRWYDPRISFPEPLRMIGSLDDLRPGDFGLHIWRPRPRS